MMYFVTRGRNYEVDLYDQPVSTVPAGGWVRGDIVRSGTVQFRSTVWDLFIYDPNNPLTWNTAAF